MGQVMRRDTGRQSSNPELSSEAGSLQSIPLTWGCHKQLKNFYSVEKSLGRRDPWCSSP